MSALIPLARVQFRENVALPGKSEPGRDFSYPEHEKILLSCELPPTPSVRMRSRFKLYLDGRTGHVLVQNPESAEVERFPQSMVQQVRYLDEVPEALRAKPALKAAG